MNVIKKHTHGNFSKIYHLTINLVTFKHLDPCFIFVLKNFLTWYLPTLNSNKNLFPIYPNLSTRVVNNNKLSYTELNLPKSFFLTSKLSIPLPVIELELGRSILPKYKKIVILPNLFNNSQNFFQITSFNYKPITSVISDDCVNNFKKVSKRTSSKGLSYSQERYRYPTLAIINRFWRLRISNNFYFVRLKYLLKNKVNKASNFNNKWLLRKIFFTKKTNKKIKLTTISTNYHNSLYFPPTQNLKRRRIKFKFFKRFVKASTLEQFSFQNKIKIKPRMKLRQGFKNFVFCFINANPYLFCINDVTILTKIKKLKEFFVKKIWFLKKSRKNFMVKYKKKSLLNLNSKIINLGTLLKTHSRPLGKLPNPSRFLYNKSTLLIILSLINNNNYAALNTLNKLPLTKDKVGTFNSLVLTKVKKTNLSFSKSSVGFLTINFLENQTGFNFWLSNKKIGYLDYLEKGNSFSFLTSRMSSRYYIRFNKKIQILNIVKILYISLMTQDLHLLRYTTKYALKKLRVHQQKHYFQMIEHLLKYHFSLIFKDFGLKGYHYEVKGKIGLKGKARKKKIQSKLLKSSKSNAAYKVVNLNEAFSSDSGALSFKLTLFY